VTPRVSVVLPTWNRRELLLQALGSVQNQTFGDLEILVCDDGSTDGSREAVEAVARTDARIRWVQGAHSGLPGVNRNRGIRAARGEWIAFQDSDDLWVPGKLERQLAVLKASPDAAFVYGYAVDLSPDGARRRMTPFRVQRGGRMFETLLLYSLVQTPTVLVRRELLTAAEDYELYLRLAARAPFHFVPEDLVHCRAQPGGLSADVLAGIDQVERVVKAAIEREKVGPALAARALARLDLRRYRLLLLRGAPAQERLPPLRSALERDPGYLLARALLVADRAGGAGLVRLLAGS
jgi:glycosyltransferase involved in cell wall biosynthesis